MGEIAQQLLRDQGETQSVDVLQKRLDGSKKEKQSYKHYAMLILLSQQWPDVDFDDIR